MVYKFSYKISAFDLWQLSMYSIYGSMVGMCNIIFTVSMLLLTAKFWGNMNGPVRLLLVLASCLFLIIEPIGIYYRAKKQASAKEQMEIAFDDRGVHVKAQDQSSDLKWNAIKGISKKPTMMIIFSTHTHGFVMPNKVLGTQKEAFYEYIVSKISKE